jgi:hypothetical protein
MKVDYKIKEETAKLEVQIEKGVLERLLKMEKYSKHTASELTNTALKRFISQHNDFMPPEDVGIR